MQPFIKALADAITPDVAVDARRTAIARALGLALPEEMPRPGQCGAWHFREWDGWLQEHGFAYEGKTQHSHRWQHRLAPVSVGLATTPGDWRSHFNTAADIRREHRDCIDWALDLAAAAARLDEGHAERAAFDAIADGAALSAWLQDFGRRLEAGEGPDVEGEEVDAALLVRIADKAAQEFGLGRPRLAQLIQEAIGPALDGQDSDPENFAACFLKEQTRVDLAPLRYLTAAKEVLEDLRDAARSEAAERKAAKDRSRELRDKERELKKAASGKLDQLSLATPAEVFAADCERERREQSERLSAIDGALQSAQERIREAVKAALAVAPPAYPRLAEQALRERLARIAALADDAGLSADERLARIRAEAAS